MKQALKTSLIILTSAMVGGALTAGTLKHIHNAEEPAHFIEPTNRLESFFKDHEKIQSHFKNFLADPFFTDDLSKEMNSLHREMQEQMGQLSISNSAYEISEREDSQNIYYDIKVPNINATSINTNIKEGQIIISGTVEKKNNNEPNSTQSFFKSSFQRSFPLPENIDQHKMEMTNEGNKIVLRFPKITV